jgi:4-hydroxybenzoate polyprenyltransferase
MAVTLAYSFYLKRTTVADVMTLAGLYTLRVLLGGVATDIAISTWLLEFSMFFFLCLAFVKRYTEFDVLQLPSEGRIPGRGYITGDKDWMLKMGAGSGYLSVLVLALYINDEAVADLYNQPKILLLICPALLYWISRLWLLTSRGYLEDDPIVFAIKDSRSYLVGLVIASILVAATF